MADIELGKMTDHDLLVVAVTKINGWDEKLDGVCLQVVQHEKQLTVLQTEHDERKDLPNCSTPIKDNRKHYVTGGIGITAIILAIIDYFLKR
jgi:hypothetical protein